MPAISLFTVVEYKNKNKQKKSKTPHQNNNLGETIPVSEDVKVNLLIKKGNDLHKDLITEKILYWHFNIILNYLN